MSISTLWLSNIRIESQDGGIETKGAEKEKLQTLDVYMSELWKYSISIRRTCCCCSYHYNSIATYARRGVDLCHSELCNYSTGYTLALPMEILLPSDSLTQFPFTSCVLFAVSHALSGIQRREIHNKCTAKERGENEMNETNNCCKVSARRTQHLSSTQ